MGAAVPSNWAYCGWLWVMSRHVTYAWLSVSICVMKSPNLNLFPLDVPPVVTWGVRAKSRFIHVLRIVLVHLIKQSATVLPTPVQSSLQSSPAMQVFWLVGPSFSNTATHSEFKTILEDKSIINKYDMYSFLLRRLFHSNKIIGMRAKIFILREPGCHKKWFVKTNCYQVHRNVS